MVASNSPRDSAPWGDDPLAWLIDPHDAQPFFADIYEREPLVINRDEPERYRELLSVAEIDSLIASVDLREGSIDMARAEPRISPDQFMMPNGIADRSELIANYQQGATLVLPALHLFKPRLSELCQALESVFTAHFQTNIYLTPPGGQGFRTHYDNHDVFVLQIEGDKAWRLYDNPVDTPYRGEGFEPGSVEIGEVVSEFVLKAGDSAYVPRGLLHDASSESDEASLHITVGVIVKTWADLILEAVSEVAVDDPDFRRSLPVGFAHKDFDRESVREHFRDLMQRLADNSKMDAAFDLYVDNFIRSRAVNTFGGVTDASRPLPEGQRFKARPWHVARIEETEKGALLVAPPGERLYPVGALKGLQLALSGKPFTTSDLATLLPDATEKDARDLINRLISWGIVSADEPKA